MKDTTLIVSDLDGTLLNPKAELTPFTISVVNNLILKGFKFTIATARALESAMPILKPLNLQLPIVLHNGVSIYDPQLKKYIIQRFLPVSTVNQIINLYYKYKLNPLVYALNKADESKTYYTKITHKGERFYFDGRLKKGDPRFQKVDVLPKDNEKVFEVNVIDREENIQPVYLQIQANFDVSIHFMEDIYTPGFHWLEITHPSATKKNAINYVKKMLNIKKIICFGDSNNDLSMFELADECYAVENATKELKEIASGVIKNNEENGVALFLLEKFIKGN
ncbi:MAG: HAD family hydrolase [Promethearchaeota archaeon]